MSNKKEEIIILKPNTLRSEHALPLSITEQRIMFYAIYKIQTNATSVSFTKSELDEMFGVDFGCYRDIKKSLIKLKAFGLDVINDETEDIDITIAFSRLIYRKGVFTFKFNEDFLPAINNQKRFLQFGMMSIGNFKCRYTVYLYDFLKDSMWGKISLKKNLSLSEFRSIFKIDETKYKENKNFKSRVWLPAMNEINLYTDYTISIETKGQGIATTFTIHRIKNEDLSKKAAMLEVPSFKCGLGKNIVDEACSKCLRINICPFDVNITSYTDYKGNLTEPLKLANFMHTIFWQNTYYDLQERINNNVATELENLYYKTVIDKAKQIAEFAYVENDDLKPKQIDVKKALKDDKEFFESNIETVY